MPSLTLKGIPEGLLGRLRVRAESERRSLNQEAIRLLERALDDPRPSFSEAHQAFVRSHGPTPFDDDAFETTFANLRSLEPGRPSPFDDPDSVDGAPSETGA